MTRKVLMLIMMLTASLSMIAQDEVPATRPEACGNYLLHDLPMCKWECVRYLDRLRNDFHSEYSKLQVVLEDGKVFADA